MGGQHRRRLDAELVAEQASEVVVNPERLDRSAARRQCVHQQRAGTFAEWLLVAQSRQLGDEPVELTGLQTTFSACLVRTPAQLRQARRLDLSLVELVQ